MWPKQLTSHPVRVRYISELNQLISPKILLNKINWWLRSISDHFYPFVYYLTYPDNPITISGHDDVVNGPFHHLWHSYTQDLLVSARSCVNTCQFIAVYTPHMKVSSCASSNISLKEKYKDLWNTSCMKSTKIKQPVWKSYSQSVHLCKLQQQVQHDLEAVEQTPACWGPTIYTFCPVIRWQWCCTTSWLPDRWRAQYVRTTVVSELELSYLDCAMRTPKHLQPVRYKWVRSIVV